MQPSTRLPIIPFSTEVLPVPEQVGQKAFRLIELTKAGFPVPDGFVIAADAYRTFLETLPIAELDPADPAFATQLDKIRLAIAEAPLPDDLGRAIGEAYRQVGGRVVIRLSGNSRLLLAGSRVGLEGIEKVIESVKECWASLWSPPIYSFCQQQGCSLQELALGVVVQSYIPAETSGILTTINPVSGHDEEMVIAACWGLGEALVAGKVRPDRFLVSPETIEATVAEKTIALFSSQEGPYEAKLAPKESRKRTLDDRKVRELYDLGRRVMELYGAPQIIDFAHAAERFYLLRTRPFLNR